MKRLLAVLLVLLAAVTPASAAIAFDAAGGPQYSGSATSITWSHTTTGSDRILIVFHHLASAAGDIGTGCTYNSVAMTLIDKHQNTANGVGYTYLYYLVAPTTGANSVVCSTSAAAAQEGASMSYTGASQTGQPDSFANSASGAQVTTFTTTTTVVASNTWLVGVFADNAFASSAGTGTVRRTAASVGLQSGGFDSGGTVGTGSQSLQATTATATDWVGVIASIAEAGGGGATRRNRTLMGAGQ